MKKYLLRSALVAAVIFIGAPGVLCAEPRSEMQAGVAAAVEGEVKATTPPDKAAHALKNGGKVFMGDKIETGADGQLQILLLDQTVFTLGPLSTITVDEFIFDPNNSENKAKTGVVKGIFRVVSGKVVQQKPEEMPADFSDDPDSSADAAGRGPEADSFPEAQEDALKLADLIGNESK